MITAQILIELEQKYGGIQRIDGKRGGDRMLYKVKGGSVVSHGYASLYATYLPKKIEVLLELGILRGTGLAIWSDAYPDARIIGLDQNLLYFKEYKSSLRAFGGFRKNDPEVYQFDKYAHDADQVYKRILKGQKIDVYIDDSNHSTDGIVKAFNDVLPFLSGGAVCFLEDNDEVGAILKEQYPEYRFIIQGRMTVVQL